MATVINYMTNISFLFSEYRQRVLSLLLLHPETRYHVREIARLTKTVPGTLHKELAKLAKVKVLLREVSGQQVYYQANISFPIFVELVAILRKTSGLVNVLANALAPLADKIDIALVFGSVARGTENLASDIDILIVGDVSFVEVVSAFHPLQNSLMREINPKIYKKTEWEKCVSRKESFAMDVLKNPKLFIIGSINDIGKYGR